VELGSEAWHIDLARFAGSSRSGRGPKSSRLQFMMIAVGDACVRRASIDYPVNACFDFVSSRWPLESDLRAAPSIICLTSR
jgi:hypothetical protein